jgi:hypothetical protein
MIIIGSHHGPLGVHVVSLAMGSTDAPLRTNSKHGEQKQSYPTNIIYLLLKNSWVCFFATSLPLDPILFAYIERLLFLPLKFISIYVFRARVSGLRYWHKL